MLEFNRIVVHLSANKITLQIAVMCLACPSSLSRPHLRLLDHSLDLKFPQVSFWISISSAFYDLP